MKVIGKIDFNKSFDENVEDNTVTVYDFNHDTDNTVAVLPLKFATELLQMWVESLNVTNDKVIIGILQDKLRNCNDVKQAMIITQGWLNEQNLINSILANDYSQYLVK